MFSTQAFAAGDLIYAVARQEKNLTGSGQQWGIYRQWTEVYSAAPDGGQPRLLFSDEKLPFTLTNYQAGGSVSSAVNTKTHELIAVAHLRSEPPESAPAVYAIPLHDATRARKLFDVPSGEIIEKLFVSPDGAKLATVQQAGGRFSAAIRELSSGRILHWITLDPLLGGCNREGIGWMADSNSLFFNIGTPNGDDEPSPEDQLRIGAWILSLDGASNKHLPALKPEQQHRIDPDLPGTLLGELPDGQLLYIASEQRWPDQHLENEDFLVSRMREGSGGQAMRLEGENLERNLFLFSAAQMSVAYIQVAKAGTDRSETIFVKTLDIQPAQKIVSVQKHDTRFRLLLFGFDE
jgi:hypothetical protein